MKRKLIGVVLAVCGCVASAQTVSKKADNPPVLSEQEKRTVAQIDLLQGKIMQLEREIATKQAQIEKLAGNLSAPVRATVPLVNPKPATVLDFSGDQFVINAGLRNYAVRVGDKILFARHKKEGLLIAGSGVVMRAYATDAECDVVENLSGLHTEDEVYVINRSSSPHSIARVKLATAQP